VGHRPFALRTRTPVIVSWPVDHQMSEDCSREFRLLRMMELRQAAMTMMGF